MTTLAPGATVVLRTRGNGSNSAGQPGTVIHGTVMRKHGSRFTVFWPAMDLWSTHHPEQLVLAECEPDTSSPIQHSSRAGRRGAAAAITTATIEREG